MIFVPFDNKERSSLVMRVGGRTPHQAAPAVRISSDGTVYVVDTGVDLPELVKKEWVMEDISQSLGFLFAGDGGLEILPSEFCS